MEENENGGVKTYLKNIFKKSGKKLLKIALPIGIGLVVFAGMVWYVFIDEGWWENDSDGNPKERGHPSTYTKDIVLSDTEGIILEDDMDENGFSSKKELVETGLKAIGYSDERIKELIDGDFEKFKKELKVKNKIEKKRLKEIKKIEDFTEAEILWILNVEYSKYLEKPEDLEYLMKAELVTQYPKIDSVPENKLNGVVQFVRTDIDGDGTSDFTDRNGDGLIDIDDVVQQHAGSSIQQIRDQENGKIKDWTDEEELVKAQEEIDKKINDAIKAESTENGGCRITYVPYDMFMSLGDPEIFKHFTMDMEDPDNIIIATWSASGESFSSSNPSKASSSSGLNKTITLTKINYKDMIEKYTLPFEYLWSLLVMGESYEFVEGLAQLAYDAQLVVGLYDATVTTITTNTYDYTIETLTTTTWSTTDPTSGVVVDSGSNTNTSSVNYQDVTVTTTIQNIVTEDIMYADVWFVETKTQHQRVHEEEQIVLPEVQGPSRDSVPYQGSGGGSSSEPVKNADGTYTSSSTTTKSRVVDERWNTTIDIIYDKYIRVNEFTIGKDDIKKETELNFVKLLRADDNANALLFKPINVEWLCDILEVNKDTVEMIDLTKYLINKAKNPDDESLTFDFSIFKPDDFKDIERPAIGDIGIGNRPGSGSVAGLLKRYIRSWESSQTPPMNSDGSKYIIYDDGFGNLAAGYGVDIYNGGFSDEFQAAGYSIQKGEEVEIEFVDALEDQTIQSMLSSVTSLTSGLNLKEYQIHALVSRAYNCGVSGAISTLRGSPARDFKSSYKAYWNEDTDNLIGKTSGNFSHSLYTQYMSAPTTSNGTYALGLERRRKSEWTLFQTGYYDTLGESYPTSGEGSTTLAPSIKGGSIIECADEIHRYMEENSYTYCVYGSNNYEECPEYGKVCAASALASSFKTSASNKKTCCATFVSWVLQEAGCISFHSNGANDLRNRLIGAGWQKVSKEDAQPGDVLCWDGHIEIYAGSGTSYNAGSGGAIRGSSPGWTNVNSTVCILRCNM